MEKYPVFFRSFVVFEKSWTVVDICLKHLCIKRKLTKLSSQWIWEYSAEKIIHACAFYLPMEQTSITSDECGVFTWKIHWVGSLAAVHSVVDECDDAMDDLKMWWIERSYNIKNEKIMLRIIINQSSPITISIKETMRIFFKIQLI